MAFSRLASASLAGPGPAVTLLLVPFATVGGVGEDGVGSEFIFVVWGVSNDGSSEMSIHNMVSDVVEGVGDSGVVT